MNKLLEDLKIIRSLTNECWSDNWGFVPLTENELIHMANELKFIVDPNLIVFLEEIATGESVGFALALPDLNIALKAIDGKLFPLGWVTLLRMRKKLPRLRLMLLGVKGKYRGKGADTLMHLEMYSNGANRHYTEAEFSWILEDNLPQLNPLEKLGAKRYRTYRVYEKELA